MVTSTVNKDYHICSKYDQLPYMYSFKHKKDALKYCTALNKLANKEYKNSIVLIENKSFDICVEKFITNYKTI